MKTIYKVNKNQINTITNSFFKLLILCLLFSNFSCSNDDECGYNEVYDCQVLQLNVGDACDSNGDGINNGTINDFCECIPDFPIIRSCPGFIQNGDFETLQAGTDPNTSVDNDIDLALNWKELWQSGSLADLFNDTTTNYGAGCFTGPTPLSGVFAGMWIENNSNATGSATFREGMFNELTTTINQNTGVYNLTFDYASMSDNCGASNDVKVGVYGVYHNIVNPLPANPTGVGTPSNLDLFGSANTVFLGEVVISSATTNTWSTATLTIDTSSLIIPTNGINHIMITNSHLPFDDFGRKFLAFDEFCLTN